MNRCKYCGAYLDPCERCDCEETMRERGKEKSAVRRESKQADISNKSTERITRECEKSKRFEENYLMAAEWRKHQYRYREDEIL